MPVFRQDVYDTINKSSDRLGRRVPRLVYNFATLMRGVPGFADQWSRIPGEFWAETVNDERLSIATVACPCGSEPQVEAGQMSDCACERFYFYSGVDVLVANSPKKDLRPTPMSDSEAAELLGSQPQTAAAS